MALLDINEEAAKKNAEEINSEGFTAKGYACNVLEKASCEAAREQIRLDFGTCDILLNGAGGNNPRATTDKEYYEPGDISREDIKTFFNLDPAGVEFVFNPVSYTHLDVYKRQPFLSAANAVYIPP